MSPVIEITMPVEVAGSNLVNQNPKLRQITIEEYDLMIKNGIFDRNDKIELLNGVIIEKMPKGTKHSSATDRASRIFDRAFGENYWSEIKTRYDLIIIQNLNLMLF